MNSQVKKNQPKPWLIVVVIVIVLGGCCLLLTLAGLLFMRSQGTHIEDLVSEPMQAEPQIDIEAVIPQEEEVFVPEVQPVPEETTPPTQTDEFLLAITSSGIWKVNEESQEARQLSNDVIDAPWRYRDGLSPDKKYYAYITGDINPTLVILDLQTNSRVFETALSGPNSQIKPNMDASDPGQSVLLAMQNFGNMAWSPDSTHLAFVAAMDNSSTDLYLLNATDLALSRLSDENSNAAYINWSPDGRFIQFITVNNFGTGAGFDMDAIWVYDRSQVNTKLLEQATSSGEEFISWIDNESFYINSWSAMCSSYNLRAVNAATGSQDVIYESCFSGVAYDPAGKIGLFAVGDLFIDACLCGEVTDYGTYIFGEILGMGDLGIKFKKFEYINAYNVELLDPGNLFAVYTDQGLTHLFDNTGFPLTIPNMVSGLKPLPSPTGEFWAWYPYYGERTGLWVTDNQSNGIEISATASKNVVWREDGERLYFFELNRVFFADAPGFTPIESSELPVSQIFAIGK